MADKIGYTDAKEANGTPIPQLWHENGDGSYSAAPYVEGGATTIADGADVAQGAKADAAVTNPALSASEIALLKGLLTVLAASLPLPTGAATATNQSTANTSLASLDTKTPAKGTAAAAASTPVVIASDQSAVPISAASLPLPSGASTAANQSTGNTSMASLDTKTPPLGAAAAAASTPVTLANDGVFATNFGLQADAAATTDTGSFSFTALFKRLLQRFVVDSTDRIRVSLYGKASAAGDTALSVTAAGAAFVAATTGATGADAESNTIGYMRDTVGNLRLTTHAPFGFNGATWDRRRVPNTFKTATATASGDTALWTPASGKKFRLMRFRIEITADAATAGGAVIDIVLRDATTGLAASMSVFVPAIAGTAFGNSVSTGWIDWGNGYLSTAANAVLNINLSATLSSGKVRVIAIGTEE